MFFPRKKSYSDRTNSTSSYAARLAAVDYSSGGPADLDDASRLLIEQLQREDEKQEANRGLERAQRGAAPTAFDDATRAMIEQIQREEEEQARALAEQSAADADMARQLRQSSETWREQNAAIEAADFGIAQAEQARLEADEQVCDGLDGGA